MAEWFVRLRDRRQGVVRGEYLINECECEVRNSEPGGFSGEIALGQKKRNRPAQGILRDEFGPYRTIYEVWRHSAGNGVCISDGYVDSLNLQKNRDTALISGKDWKEYLRRRFYPFTPEDYINYNADNAPAHWRRWPKQWTGPTPIKSIVRDLLLAMRTATPIDESSTQTERNAPTATGVPSIVWNLDDAGTTGTYKIFPGDQTSIYDHIDKFATMRDGFEWDILPQSLEFRMYAPLKFPEVIPVYNFTPDEFEINGAFDDFDWTNDGPDGTFLVGLGSGRHKVGATWTTEDNLDEFGRFDLLYDYGEMQDYDMILNKLKDQNDLWPQKKLVPVLLNPEFLQPNFYTGGRPRHMIANYIKVTRDFAPLHKVDAFFKIDALKWNIDTSTNELVGLELTQQYEVETGHSGATEGAAQ